MIIQILLQLLLGFAALLVVKLDYIWTDKRRTIFKHGRSILFWIMVIIIAINIYLVIQNEKNVTKEKVSLQNELNNLKDTLSSVKHISEELIIKMDPIIEMAQYRYPNLSEKEALYKLRLDFQKLENLTETLKEKEQIRNTKDHALEKQKQTKPDVDANLEINENGDVFFKFKFENDVPTRYNPDLYLEENGFGLLTRIYTKWPEIHPVIGRIYAHKYDNVKNLNYVQEKEAIIVMRIQYESIYIAETGNSDLKGIILKRYLLNIPKKTFKPH